VPAPSFVSSVPGSRKGRLDSRTTVLFIVLPLAIAALFIGAYLVEAAVSPGTWEGGCTGAVSASVAGQCGLADDPEYSSGTFQSQQDCLSGAPPGIPQSDWACVKVGPSLLDVVGSAVAEFGLVVPVAAVVLGFIELYRTRHNTQYVGR